MSITNYAPQRYTVIEESADADSYGLPVQAGDFKTRIVELLAGEDLDGDLVVYESNQNDVPPDVSLPVSADNEYTQVGYTSRLDQSYLDTDNPFNPAGVAGMYGFNVETTGSQWIIACILNRTAGTTEKMVVTLLDNQ